MSVDKSSVPETSRIVLNLPGEERDPEPDFSASLKLASEWIAARKYLDAANLLEGELQKTVDQAEHYGRKACHVFLQLGICRYELGQLDKAQRVFDRGLELSRRIKHLRATGTLLHELSLVALKRGDVPGAICFARESLVVKLAHVLDTAAKDRPSHQARRYDPAIAVDHLAGLMSIDASRFTDVRSLREFAMEAYEAHNDLALLVRSLLALGLLAQELDRNGQSAFLLARAVSISRVAGPTMPFSTGGNRLGPLSSLIDPATREATEASLIAQFRAIATGLLVDRLRRGEELSEDIWWQQFKSLRVPSPPYLIDADDAKFQAFQQEMIEAAVARAPRIKSSELMHQTVTIDGNEMPIWREGAINRRLAEMGSSLRLFFAGSDIVRAGAVLAAMGHPTAMPVTPDVFIFGEVAPMTTLCKAYLFDFTKEYAVSAYINANSDGMVDQGRVVVRRMLMLPINEIKPPPGHPAEELLKLTDEQCRLQGTTRDEGRRRFVYGHELSHVLEQFPPGEAAGFSSLRAIMREDICRFLATPRSVEELYNAFAVGFDVFPELYYPPGESPAEMPFDKMILELRGEGLIETTPDKRFCLARRSTG